MVGAAVEVEKRQQRGAGDARLRVGLHDAGDGRGDVEIGFARLFDDPGQLFGAEAAPPVELRQRQLGDARVLRTAGIGARNIEPGLGIVAAEQASAERKRQADGVQHHEHYAYLWSRFRLP